MLWEICLDAWMDAGCMFHVSVRLHEMTNTIAATSLELPPHTQTP